MRVRAARGRYASLPKGHRIELFLVFILPAKFPTGVVKATIIDLNYATLSEARARNLL